LESGPLSSPEFAEWAEEVVLFCHVTTRIPGRQYDGLLGEKGGRGFPYLVFLDEEGEVISSPNGRSVDAFRAGAAAAQAFLDLRNLENPTPAQQVELFLTELDMGRLNLAEANERKAGLSLTAEQEAQVAEALTDLEILAMLEEGQPRTPDAQAALGRRYKALWDDGRRPNGQRAKEVFYIMLLEAGFADGDADLFEGALGELRTEFGGNPRARQFFQQQEQRLEQLRNR
jgi:hypothetical protein